MNSGYGAMRAASGTLREDSSWPSGISELELQASFYRGDFGLEWTGTEGERIEMIHPGRWNREPGPDFCDALLRIDDREVAGDIEIDVRARDWEQHGHRNNPAFSQVVLHGFFRPGARRFYTSDPNNRAVTQVVLGDSAVPSAPVHRGIYEPLAESDAKHLVTAAGFYRFYRKHRAFRNTATLCGEDEALFQALAAGLGYKNNKIPFLLVAQRTRLARARARNGEALLFGVAGFLQADDFDEGDAEERAYLGPLWREWWTIRDSETRLVLPADSWKFSSLRPSNHPHRRLGALAALVESFSLIRESWQENDVERFRRLLAGLQHSYWGHRWNLSRAKLPRPMALVGADRVLDLTINAFAPAVFNPELGLEIQKNLGGPAPSRKVNQAAEWLCGCAMGRTFSSALQQQGLIQLYDDFFPACPAKVLENYRLYSTSEAKW